MKKRYSSLLVAGFLIFCQMPSGLQADIFTEYHGSARAASLGGAYSAIVSGPSGIFWNPAALPLPTRINAEMTMDDVYSLTDLSMVYFCPHIGAIGWGMMRLAQTGANIDHMYNVSYGLPLFRSLSLGIGLNINRQVVTGEEKTALGLNASFDLHPRAWKRARGDSGFVRFMKNVFSERFRLNLTVQNALMKFEAPFRDRQANLKLGVSWWLLKKTLLISWEKNFLNDYLEHGIGLEFVPFKKLALRYGFRDFDFNRSFAGIGLKLPDFGFDYTYNFQQKSHLFSMHYRVGQTKNTRANTYYRKGLAHLRAASPSIKGIAKYNDAISSFNTAIFLNRDHGWARYYKKYVYKRIKTVIEKEYKSGLALVRKRKYVAAYRSFNMVLKLRSGHKGAAAKLKQIKSRVDAVIKAKNRYGINAFNRKKYGQAMKYFNQVMAIDPGNDTADDYIDKIIDLRKGTAAKWYKTGRYYYRIGKWPNAIYWFRKAVSYNPRESSYKSYLYLSQRNNTLSILLKRGAAQYKGRKYAKAHGTYAYILRLFPGNGTASYYLRLCKQQMRRQVPTFYSRGLTAFNRQKYKSAIYWFNKVLVIYPGGYSRAVHYRNRARAKLKALGL